jgi:hypothetical protein
MERNKIIRWGIFIISIMGLIGCISVLFPQMQLLIISSVFIVYIVCDKKMSVTTLIQI